MSNSISLTASMRSNLLSLQKIAGQVDLTQNRLSTGLKVNSAIDNPSSYYTAVSLNNRASDLSSLLDSMAQGIQTIKAATEGLEAGAGLLEQAAATATQALETTIPAKSWFEQQEGVAAVVSTKEELLAAIDSGKKGDIVIYGQIDMGNTAITLKEGQNLTGIGAYGISDNERGKFSALNFEVTGMIGSFCLRNSGNLSDLSIRVTGNAEKKNITVIDNKITDKIILKNLDLYAKIENRGNYTTLIDSSNVSGNSSDKVLNLAGVNNLYLDDSSGSRLGKVFKNCHVVTDPGTILNIKSDDTAFESTTCEFNDSIINQQNGFADFALSNVTCNGSTVLNGFNNYIIYKSTLTLNDQSRVDNALSIHNATLIINSAAASINITTSYLLQTNNYSETSSATVKAVAGSKISLAGQVYQTNEDIDHTITGKNLRETPPQYQKVEGETYTQPDRSWLDNLAILQTYQKKNDGKQYTEIIKQYDSLIKDSSYKGINLLREQDLTVTFNENRSAQLSVQGKDASAKTLGLVTTDWQNQGDVVKSIQELTEALTQIRQMSSELGNYYSIVTTRENFTQNLINVLTEGADKLKLADMNEESANMLALQTRQQLAVNSLSLASQASQSILKLF